MPQRVRTFWSRLDVLVAAWLWTFVFCNVAGAGEASTAFDFNGPSTSWQTDEAGVGRVLSHECTAGGARDTAGMERIVVAAAGGESVRLSCPTAQVVVLQELVVRLWVKASRPDIQLAARVCMPRTAGGGAAAKCVLVRGERYTRPDQWQQLVLHDVPKQLAQQVRMLRSASKTEIDPREAFVEAVVLIVPGDPQGVEVATDDLVVDGVVRSAPEIQQLSYPAGDGGRLAGDGGRAAVGLPGRSVSASLRPVAPPGVDGSTPGTAGSVRLQGDILLVKERPFLPRVIQYQGEPLRALAERGLNVVWLDGEPSAEQSAAAEKLGLWFLGRPPRPETLARDGLGRPDDRVIAWFLEDAAMEGDPGYTGRWSELVRARDAAAGRPVIIAPQEDWGSASRAADVLAAWRERLGLMPSAEYDQWLAARAGFGRPGMPLWACLPSQYGLATGWQVSALSGGKVVAPPNVSTGQLQSLVDVACARGIRGFVFHSHTPLTGADGATRARANSVELVNRRLQRLEPWLASGNVFGRIASADSAWTGIVLNVDRARLMIPVGDAAARGTAAASREEVEFVAPGVPESCQVYALSPVALKTLSVERIAGGMRLSLRPDDETFVLMTEDPRVVHSMRQHINRYGDRVVVLQRELAAWKAGTIANTAGRLSSAGIDCRVAAQRAASAAALLQQADAARAAHHLEQAYDAVAAAHRVLDQSAAELRQLINTPKTPYSNPLALSDEGMAELAVFERGRGTMQRGENLLHGGDFEDVGQLTQMGWQHYQNQAAGVESQAELSVSDPRHGTYCLLLRAAGRGESRPAAEGASVWIESPPLPLTAGQIVEIAGWAHVEPQSGEAGEGLQIIDSVGGPETALAIGRTNGWERFEIVRAIPEAVELRLTFALSGLGVAQLDAVMVRPLQPAAARQRPPIVGPASTAESSPTPVTGPLFIAPGVGP